MELKLITTRATLLLVGLLLVSGMSRAGSGANKLYDQLNKIDRGTEEAIQACNQLKDASIKLYKEMQDVKEEQVKPTQWTTFKDLRSQIFRAQDRLPSVCIDMRRYRTPAISNKIELASSCLSCLGDGDCSSQSKYEKCQNYLRWMQEALADYGRQEEEFHKYAATFNRVIEWLKNM
jgi:hypothetical protein